MKKTLDKFKDKNAAKAAKITAVIAAKFKEKEQSSKKIDLSKIAKEVTARREKILSDEKVKVKVEAEEKKLK